MSAYDAAENITDEANNVYDARDVRSASPTRLKNLYDALSVRIAQFTVEFLYTNHVKPHVVFKLNFATPIGPGRRINSARVSMELGEGDKTGEQGPGACQIKLCGYTGRTARASAGFQFTLRANMTLAHMIQLINGEYAQLPNTMRTDMKKFEFVDINNYFDGCRDWIAQGFVRAHAAGFVDWAISGILGPDGQPIQRESLRPRPNARVTLINWHGAGFHDVIGKFFAQPQAVSGSATPVVYYHDLPVENGIFWAPHFQRFVTDVQQRFRLPYRVPQPNTGAAGTTAGPAGRGGGVTAGRGAPAAAAGRGAAPPATGRGAAPPATGRGAAPPATGRGAAPPPTGRGAPPPATGGRGAPAGRGGAPPVGNGRRDG
ncbi:hypothetical protein N657DRAFT_690027 [Parathielavia appendiculata]|uniref:Uncharacterized protein n=1 Tax=Parathielavia appendiculata TaxID=2587402 RepID=A0AAN6Z428_9PEZI|nr:hypothetical protein N657DRAFT_690027 [Parathielavia appendiculata]